MRIETEVKLVLDAAGLDRLARAATVDELAMGPWRSERLVSVYYDTPGRELAAAGLALRVRHFAGRRVQAVKARRDAVRRAEWECEIEGDEPDPAAVPDPAVRRTLEGVRGPLVPLFETNFERRSRLLRLPGGGSAELALDVGEIRAGARAEALAEAELELVEGTAEALLDLVGRLRAAVPCALGSRTKAERGYALLRGPE